jgi:hypothetical protein
MGPEDAFDALCRYSRSRYSYAAVGSGVAAGLRSGQFNCGGAADLVVGVVLYLSGQDMDVDRAYGLSGGLRAVVTPRIEQAGVIIENNLTGGGGRMLFSGGHTIAMIGDDQFDLITGRRDHRIDFLLPNKLPDTAGKSTFGCDIDGVARVFTQVDGKTTEGLSKFNVVPPI